MKEKYSEKENIKYLERCFERQNRNSIRFIKTSAQNCLQYFQENVEENLTYLINTIIKNKPNSVKGTYIESISVSSTMGPSIKIDKNSFDI